MDDLIRHGIEARKDWNSYHTASAEPFPRYHNRPDCEDGSVMPDKDIRAGTDGRALCDKCRQAQRVSR
jgi:hypothetical protein